MRKIVNLILNSVIILIVIVMIITGLTLMGLYMSKNADFTQNIEDLKCLLNFEECQKSKAETLQLESNLVETRELLTHANQQLSRFKILSSEADSVVINKSSELDEKRTVKVATVFSDISHENPTHESFSCFIEIITDGDTGDITIEIKADTSNEFIIPDNAEENGITSDVLEKAQQFCKPYRLTNKMDAITEN